jgi:hypothetical protein
MTSVPYVNELVSSQLLVQLPQNSGARGKGNWSLETGQLQSLAGYLISWRCDITGKRASKSKSSTRKDRAKASGSEVHSGHGKGHAKAREGGDVPAPVSPEPAQGVASIPVSSSRC